MNIFGHEFSLIKKIGGIRGKKNNLWKNRVYLFGKSGT